MSQRAKQKVRERRDTLRELAASSLNSAKWARELLEAADVNYKCQCGGYLQPTDEANTYRCEECNRTIVEQGEEEGRDAW